MTESFSTSVQIGASPERVFEYFLRPELLVRWMGQFARLDARPGGLFSVDINGVLIRGHYVTIDPPKLIEIAWGEAGNAEMPPGATLLAIRFEPIANGTLVRLDHSGLAPSEAAKHAIGWPHFLERLAVAGAGEDPGVDPWSKVYPSN